MKNLIAFALIIIAFVGCNRFGKPVDFDYGHVDNGVYLNSYFDISINLPKDWIVQSKEQTENLAKKGSELIAGDNQNLKTTLKVSEINVANLLSAFQYEYGSAVSFNPNIIINAENVKNYPGIKTGSDYLFQAKKLIEQSQLKYDSISSVFDKEIINGIEFYKMNSYISHMGLDIKQTIYCTILKGFCFNIIVTYVDEDQKEALYNAVKSIKYTN